MENNNTVSLQYHLETVISLNDQRYKEVNEEREKALKIKEEADKVALNLAYEIQNYKNQKGNELREQLSNERNLYATKQDVIASSEKIFLVVQPLVDYANSQRGKGQGLNQGWIYLLGGLSLIATILAIIGFFKP